MTTMVEQRQTVLDDDTIKAMARKEFISWIDHILERRQQDATHLANDSGLSPSTILRLINSKSHPHLPSMTTLRKISNGSGYPIPRKLIEAYEVQNVEEVSSTPKSRPASGPQARTARDETVRVRTVVVRHVSTLPSSLAPIIKSEPRIEVPPMLSDDDTAFAFKMPDDSLAPVVRAGAMVFATKSRDPASGDVVLFVDQTGRAKVRLIQGVDERGYMVSRPLGGDAEMIGFEEIKDFGIVEIMSSRR